MFIIFYTKSRYKCRFWTCWITYWTILDRFLVSFSTALYGKCSKELRYTAYMVGLMKSWLNCHRIWVSRWCSVFEIFGDPCAGPKTYWTPVNRGTKIGTVSKLASLVPYRELLARAETVSSWLSSRTKTAWTESRWLLCRFFSSW